AGFIFEKLAAVHARDAHAAIREALRGESLFRTDLHSFEITVTGTPQRQELVPPAAAKVENACFSADWKPGFPAGVARRIADRRGPVAGSISHSGVVCVITLVGVMARVFAEAGWAVQR